MPINSTLNFYGKVAETGYAPHAYINITVLPAENIVNNIVNTH